MDDLDRVLDTIPQPKRNLIITLDELSSKYYVGFNDPLLYYLYKKFNGDCLNDDEKIKCDLIISALKGLREEENARNVAYMERHKNEA